jgi:class 3 adenylate cyclase
MSTTPDGADPIPPTPTPSAGSARVVEDAPRRTGRWRAFRNTGVLDIQSKLLIMLLAVSILAALVVGAVGYVNGRNSLQDAAFQQVTSLRESRTREIERTFSDISGAIVLDSRNQSAIGATKAFTSGFDQLQDQPVTASERSSVDGYYRNRFVPQLDKATASTADPKQFTPTSNAQTYLQSKYTAPFTDYDTSLATDDVGDGSAWSAAHAEYQDYFREQVDQLGYEDVLLLNTTGDVVYSAYAGPDLGTNVETGPYRDSNLATGYQKALQLTSSDGYAATDFQAYTPSLGAPTAWVFSPVGDDGQIIGVLAVQVPTQTINSVMTGSNGWKSDGLGNTGESYLVGQDRTMRSDSRQLIQHPKQYQQDVVNAGEAPQDAREQVRDKSSILRQTVSTTPVTRALQGRTGTIITTDYRGRETLSAYAPVEVDGLHWVIAAQVDTSEAFTPVDTFTRTLALSLVGIIVLVCLLALVLAQVFVRPIRRLQTAVNRVSAGDIGVEVAAKPGDEIGDLGIAFNDMSRSLKVKQDLLDEQRRQNDQLLLTMMPEEVAKRYKQGDENIAEEHQDVAVIFADIIGFDDFSRSLGAADGLKLVNGIWRSFDEAAARIGIERVRSTRSGYLASCGLTVPRVDYARRMVEFTNELQTILERFNAQHGSSVGLRAGIDTGRVTSGLVGPSRAVYDMWGDAVSLAYRVQGIAPTPGVFATQRVVNQLGDTVPMHEEGTVETQAGPQRVWKLDRPAS